MKSVIVYSVSFLLMLQYKYNAVHYTKISNCGGMVLSWSKVKVSLYTLFFPLIYFSSLCLLAFIQSSSKYDKNKTFCGPSLAMDRVSQTCQYVYQQH